MTSTLDLSRLIAKQIGVFPHVEKVILFGSQARGDARKRSDIDLAVECPQADMNEWAMIQAMEDVPYTFTEIDIIRFETASEKLQAAIKQDGVVLYERNS